MSYMKFAALGAFSAIALGAFGAHKLKSTLDDPSEVSWNKQSFARLDAWKTASTYQLLHSIALLALRPPEHKHTFWLFLAGSGLFSGSLYCYAFTGEKSQAMLAPVGGLLLMAGWVLLAIRR